MADNKHNIIENISLTRKNLIELLVVAILIAFGTNLVAGQLISSAIFQPFFYILLGVMICLVSAIYLTTRLLSKRIESRGFKAFLPYNEKDKKLLVVPRYRFSEELSRYLDAAFTENPALKVAWDSESLRYISDSDGVKTTKSARLLSEAVEYFLLERLSIHLTDYFNRSGFQKKNLKTYGRKDIPEVLLSNKFLELFSRPPEERPAFVDDTIDVTMKGELVYAYGSGGVIFNRFDLILPKKSIVRRLGSNNIEIETDKLKVSMSTRFEGICTVIPPEFEKYYLGFIDTQPDPPYELNVVIKVKIKFWALFSRSGWDYYHWIDSFLELLERDISQKAFFNRINWETAYTVIQCLNRDKPKQSKSQK
jgi:hypothetical protein